MTNSGAEKTFIVGRKGKNSTGCGTGALRCALLRGSAVLKGFMLVEGNTADGNNASPRDVDHNGGGVLTLASGTVYGCVITNCNATKGGGAMNGTFVNCRFYDNGARSVSWGDSARNIACYGCYFGPQRGNNGIHGPTAIENCTFDGTKVYSVTSRQFKNCLFRNPTGVSMSIGTSSSPSFYNCLFDQENADTWTNNVKGKIFLNCSVAPLANLVLDNGRPVRGACAAVDAGDDALVPSVLNGQDASCGQRVYNGRVDIGALECDDRAYYARILGASGLTVEAASPSVMAAGKVVCLSDGSELDVRWNVTANNRISFESEVTGAGELTAAWNGQSFVCQTAVDGHVATRFRSEGVNRLNFSFAGLGAADIGSFAGPQGFLLMFR